MRVGERSFVAEQGDCYVIAGRRPYRIAADPDIPEVFAAPYYEHPDGTPRDVAQVGEGHDTTLLGAGFTCDRETARLLEVLPPVIHVRDPGGTAQTTIGTTIGLIKQEIDHKPIVDRLCQVLLLQVLRDHDTSLDPQLGKALQALHADLGRPWTGRPCAEGLQRHGRHHRVHGRLSHGKRGQRRVQEVHRVHAERVPGELGQPGLNRLTGQAYCLGSRGRGRPGAEDSPRTPN
ncbi:hypothetical protein BBK82_45700 [Lentzea guizhouensis]|uniref:AraC-type transcription regulator ligand-binding domain-containing protein n=1 Tax=Lentzea guizhouensis TaxID=1586287 RepID=A0A1B2HWS0_9PSEU|nr:hypothetical protein BBK82_45700 [Lentzea guizhouensis]